MIKEILIYKEATFNNPVQFNPSKINYFYGSNGSGKTTLSKLIASPEAFQSCNLVWENNVISTLVYNRDFVKNNFDQDIKGIFTLGRDAIEAKEIVENNKEKIRELQELINTQMISFENQESKIIELETDTIEKCWEIKDKYKDTFKPAFTGFIGTKKSFFEKCKAEQLNDSILIDEHILIEKCNQIFQDNPEPIVPISQPISLNLSILENEPILSEKIIGKEDIPIGRLISKLQNSNWVEKGLIYLEESSGLCPFCQQTVKPDLKDIIEEVFDETYKEKCAILADYIKNYKSAFDNYIINLENILQTQIPIIDTKQLNAPFEFFKEKYRFNSFLLNDKLKDPSISVTLESVSSIVQEISVILQNFINKINDYNTKIRNLANEKITLKKEIWKFISNATKLIIENYDKKVNGLITGKVNIQKNINEKKDNQRKLESEILSKQKEITGTVQTRDEINKILVTYKFTNFKIELSDQNYYKIIREDGADAKKTLSEGEYTFITFLYFYQLLKGSQDPNKIQIERIIAIDDPISSLDSNVLFIVSNLIKDIIFDCKNQQNGIEQVFILTHNIYFHKEVTFRHRGGKWVEESFWILRKHNNSSTIKKYDSNPILTTYELLWREIKDPHLINNATIFNTMRRILEFYFKIIGNIDYETEIGKFEGEEKVIFRSLLSWLNDGSHFINDDLLISSEPELIEKQLHVFKSIFEKLGHEGHYKMMMEIC